MIIHCPHCGEPIIDRSHIEIGRWRIAEEQVWFDGKPVRLTATEVRALRQMADDWPHFTAYRRLYDVITRRPGLLAGRGPIGFHANVRTVMKRIRLKVREATGAPSQDVVENQSGYGFRIAVPEESAQAAMERAA